MIKVLREIHEAPPWVLQRVTRAGGLNRFGEPNFRVVWGGSRLAWIGGRWVGRDDHGNIIRETVELRREPKYVPVDRWHVERWLPPECYGSPSSWYELTVETEGSIRVPTLGPYPSRGEYEHCFTLQDARGEFIPLTATACEWIARAVEWSRQQPSIVRRAAHEAREIRRMRDWDGAVDAILEEGAPAFAGQPFISL